MQPPDINQQASLTDSERRAGWRPVAECVCPRCGGMASRIKRRPIDLIIGLFRGLHRYRCRSIGCEWEGNRKVRSLLRDRGNIGWQ